MCVCVEFAALIYKMHHLYFMTFVNIFDEVFQAKGVILQYALNKMLLRFFKMRHNNKF